MNNDNQDPEAKGPATPAKQTSELETISNVANGETSEGNMDNLQDDIIRNDAIPETSRDTPGSNGAFPVGAFDNSKD